MCHVRLERPSRFCPECGAMQYQDAFAPNLQTVHESSEPASAMPAGPKTARDVAKDDDPKVTKKDERVSMAYQPTEEERRRGYSGVLELISGTVVKVFSNERGFMAFDFHTGEEITMGRANENTSLSRSDVQSGSTVKVNVCRDQRNKRSSGRSGLLSDSEWDETGPDDRDRRESEPGDESQDEGNDSQEDDAEPHDRPCLPTRYYPESRRDQERNRPNDKGVSASARPNGHSERDHGRRRDDDSRAKENHANGDSERNSERRRGDKLLSGGRRPNDKHRRGDREGEAGKSTRGRANGRESRKDSGNRRDRRDRGSDEEFYSANNGTPPTSARPKAP